MAALTPTLTLGNNSGSSGLSSLVFAETGTRNWVVSFGAGSPGGQFYVYGDYNGSHFNGPLTSTISGSQISQTYAWGSATVNFNVLADQTVQITGSVNNTSGVAIPNGQIDLCKIGFPGVAQLGSNPLLPNLPCTGTPGFYTLDASGLVSGSTFTSYFCFSDFGGWGGDIHMGPANNGSNTCYADTITFSPGTTTFDFRLNFFTTTAEINTANATAISKFSTNFARVSQWNDTRPVGQVYLSTSQGASGYRNAIIFGGVTNYTAGDVIYYSGNWYQCTNNTTAAAGNPTVNTANWTTAASGTPLFVATNPWNNNPRGWLNNASLNVHTAAGVTATQNAIMSNAAATLSYLQSMAGGSQGIIVWDITGEQYQQGPVEYLGHPSYIGTYAPEMDGTGPGQSGSGHGIADTYFQYFTSRGYRVGVCLRATPLNLASPGTSASTGGSPYVQGNSYASNQAAFNDLDHEITYAKTRWGCTMFYVDSNPPSMYPVFQQLQIAHPDCLIAPESADFADLAMWAYCCPYQHGKFVNLVRNGITTPSYALNVYPQAQCVIDMADCYEPPRTGTTQVTVNPDLMNSVRAGSILMYRAWWNGGPEFPLLQDTYNQLVASGWSGTSPPGTASAGTVWDSSTGTWNSSSVRWDSSGATPAQWDDSAVPWDDSVAQWDSGSSNTSISSPAGLISVYGIVIPSLYPPFTLSGLMGVYATVVPQLVQPQNVPSRYDLHNHMRYAVDEHFAR